MRIGELKLLRKEYSDQRNVQLKLPHSPLTRDNSATANTEPIQKSGKVTKEIYTQKYFLFEQNFNFRSIN